MQNDITKPSLTENLPVKAPMPEPKRLDASIELIVLSSELSGSRLFQNQLNSAKVDALHVWSLHSILQFDLDRFDAIVLPYSEFKLFKDVLLGYFLSNFPHLFVFVTARQGQLEGLPIHPKVIYMDDSSFHAKDVEVTILEDRKVRQGGVGETSMDKFRRSAIVDEEEEAEQKTLVGLICSNKLIKKKFQIAEITHERLECKIFESFKSFAASTEKPDHLFVYCPLYILNAIADLDLLPNRYGLGKMIVLIDDADFDASYELDIPKSSSVSFVKFSEVEEKLTRILPES